MKFGDIYLVDFEPSFGHEYRKIRPAIVVQEESIAKESVFLTVMPLSTKISKIGPSDIFIGKDNKNKLTQDSFIKSHQISSFDKRRIIRHIGAASSPVIRQVRGYLRRHFGM